MTIKELYDGYVWQIAQIDKDIARLNGKREGLNEARNDLFTMMEDEEHTQAESENEE